MKLKSFISKLKAKFSKIITAIKSKVCSVFKGTKAEAYVDTGVKVLIAVVIGALLLGAFYTLFDDVFEVEVANRVYEMFDYAG